METYSSISTQELVRRCSASRNPEAWEEFVRRFHRLIATVVLRTAGKLGDSSRQTADDLIQETYLRLCKDNELSHSVCLMTAGFRRTGLGKGRHQDQEQLLLYQNLKRLPDRF